jgi:prepilin peptidase CpaA
MYSVIDSLPPAVVFSLISVLLISTTTDIAWHRIPNVVLAPALALALLLNGLYGGGTGVLIAIGGLAAGLAFLLPIYALGGMAAGDVKLLGVVGAFLGPTGAFVACIATLIFGAILGIFYIAWRSLAPLVVERLLQHRDALRSTSSTANETTDYQGERGFAYAPAIAAGSAFAIWQPALIAQLTSVT